MKNGRFAYAGCCRLLIWLVLWFVVAGCTLMTVTFPGDPLPRKEFNIRVLTRDFAKQFVQSVEKTADRIMAGTDDPAIQTNALRWKMNAVAELQDTVFQPIPPMPVADLSFYRESVLTHWARFEGRSEEELVPAIGTAPEVLEDFINRFAFYEQTITKRAQWATKLYMVESGWRHGSKSR